MDEEIIYQEIGALIAARRDALDLTQAKVAAKVGMSRPSLANIEVGRQRVLVHQLYAIARALDVEDPRDLLPLPRLQPGGAEAPISDAGLTQRERDQISRLLAVA